MGLKVLPLFFLAFFITILPQNYPDEKIHHLLSAGIDNLVNQKYESAAGYFKILRDKYPQLPLGDIYLASVDILRNYDLGINNNNDLIVNRLNTAMNLSEKLLEEDSNSLWYKYLYGLAQGYYAYYLAMNEDWINAFLNGISAVGLFKECLNDSTDFYEAYTAIGTFDYWKSRKLESVQWLPFIDDDTEAGIKYLEKALEHSSYNRFLAVNSLIWIYIDRKEYPKAIETAENILLQYPKARFFKWGLARALEETNKKRSIQIYYEILNSYGNPSDYNEIVLKHKIAQQYYLIGDEKSALKLCREILSKSNISENTYNRLKSRLKRIEELFGELIR